MRATPYSAGVRGTGLRKKNVHGQGKINEALLKSYWIRQATSPPHVQGMTEDSLMPTASFLRTPGQCMAQTKGERPAGP